MKEWIPVPGSAKGRLALLALEEFGRNGYEEVSVVDLAARAGVTTGSLYHHFGSKAGLYSFVRTEIERRVLDRMEGAAAATGAGDAGARTALLVAYDAAIERGWSGMLAEQAPDGGPDGIERLVGRLLGDRASGAVATAAWRAALLEGARNRARGRAALERVLPAAGPTR